MARCIEIYILIFKMLYVYFRETYKVLVFEHSSAANLNEGLWCEVV